MKANQQRLYQDVEFLTSLRPFRNYQNPESLERVVEYLEEEFKKIGATPKRQTWLASGNEYSNIIASYNPSATRRLVVGAHYDVAGEQPGADDNASAVAGLLETARLVYANQPALDYRIDFVAYCLEEPPFFGTEWMGSFVHARSLHEQRAEVLGMLCYEMIGYFSDAPHSQRYPSPELAKRYPHTANFIVVVGLDPYAAFAQQVHGLMADESAIDVQVITFPDPNGLAGLSDQRNYWNFGYPALMINDTSFIRNPHYHQPSDTIETLDFEKMTAVVDSAYRAVTQLA
jgi:Zn-dependent M28 family amino/carboxypeptidase